MQTITSPLLDSFAEYADEHNISRQHAACTMTNATPSNINAWPEIIPFDLDLERCDVDLLDNNRKSLLTDIAVSLGGQVKFPTSTIFLHGLGVIASALTKEFSIKYYNESIPVNAYVITAQPSGVGKSTINNFFCEPIKNKYDRLNKDSESKRRALIRGIENLEKGFSKMQDANIHDIIEQEDKIIALQSELEKLPKWNPILTNTTIEAAEMVAAKQGGFFSLISAEAGAIKVITGASYAKGDKVQDCNLILNAWDNEFFSGARISRDSYKGNVRASIAILAQPTAIEHILEAGKDGSGLTERFFLLSEKSNLGLRNDIESIEFDTLLAAKYTALIENILNEKDVLLNISKECELSIKHFTRKIEPKLAPSGEYGHPLIASFMSKADKHIKKIAAIIHCVEHWQDGGSRDLNISLDSIAWAKNIFRKIADTYISASAFFGFSGDKAEVARVLDYILAKSEKKEFKTDVNKIRKSVVKGPPFANIDNISGRLRNGALPILVKHNYIVLDGSRIFINPRLK